MSGPAVHDITLTRPGGSSPVTITTNGLVVSWAVTPPGTLSAEAMSADLIEAFGHTDLGQEYWAEYEHPTAGPWGGVVVGTRQTKDTGTTEVAARDFTELLVARITAKVYDQPAINAGGMARQLINDAGRANPTWIAGYELDPLLPAIPYQSRAAQVLGELARLATESDAEYQITPARILRFFRRLGRDVSATRQLVEDRQIVDFQFARFPDAARNEILAIPADQDFVRTTAVVVADSASRRRKGLRQETVVFDGMTTETQLEPAAKAVLKRMVNLGQVLTLTIEESKHDGGDPCFGWFREGDVIGALIPSANWAGTVRVLVRTLDTSANQMTCTCEVV